MKDQRHQAALISFVALCLGLFAPLSAAQTADIAVSGLPATPLIGEEICIQVDFTNAGGPTGYGPYFIGIVDEDITVTTVSFVDVTPVIELIGQFDASQTLIDPISGQTITGPVNGSAYTVRYPIGSVDAGNAALELEACGFVGPGAEIGTPLEVDLIPGFEFGDTPTGENGAILNNGGTVSGTITPQLARVDKSNTAPEGERPPGPSHEFAYVYTVNVSQLVAINTFELIDPLPPEIQWTGADVTLTAPLGLACAVDQTQLNPPTTPGGTLDVTCFSLLGTDGAGDLVVTLPVYITDILDETADDQQVITNTATINYNYQGDSFTDTDTSGVLAVHAAIQKSVSGNPLPGNKLTYTIDFQVTDFTSGATPFVISDVLSDGLDFDTTVILTVDGVPTPITAAVAPGPGPGQTSLVWDITAATGGALPAGTTGQLRYQATILDVYSDGVTPVQASDVLANDADLDYALNEGGTGSNDSGAPVTITPNTPDKVVFDPNPLPPQLSPGQEITFRLTLDIPAGNTSAVVLTDLLPRPVFDVADFDTANDFTVQPPFQSLSPTVTTSLADNSVTLDFGDIQSPTAETLTVDLRATITGEPFADDLFLTNLLASAYENAAGDTFRGVQAAGITVGAPDLQITRGVIAVANPDAQIIPAPPADPSQELADSNANNADAFDEITYLITVENIGGQAAFEVNITETIIAQQTCDPNITVVNGTGVNLSFTGNLLDPGGITLDMPLPGNDRNPAGGGAPFGADTALITLRCDLNAGVTPTETVTSEASVSWVSTQVSADTFPTRNDDATVVIARPTLTKSVIGVTPGYDGPLNRVHIGEMVTYELAIRVPEGASPDVLLEDVLDSGLAHVDVVSIAASPGLTSSVGAFDPAVLGNAGFIDQGGGTVNIDRKLVFGPGNNDNGFGIVSNANADNAVDETITLVYRTRVLNAPINTRGSNRRNRARWFWTPAGGDRQSEQVRADQIRVIEPNLDVRQLFTPDNGDQALPPDINVRVRHTGASNANTFDAVLESTVPSPLLSILGGTGGVTFTDCPAVESTAIDTTTGSERLTVVWRDFPETFTNCQVDYRTTFGINEPVAGDVLSSCAVVTYESLSDLDPALPPTPKNNPLAAERTGDPNDPGGTANTYFDQGCDSYQVLSVGVFKNIKSTDQNQSDNISGTPRETESLVIGEVATFELVLTFPEAISVDFTLEDFLPTVDQKIELVSAAFTVVGSGLSFVGGDTPVVGPIDPSAITDRDGDGINDSLFYDFGSVTNSSSGLITAADRVRVDVVTRVLNRPENAQGVVDVNTAIARFDPAGIVTDTYGIEIVEPVLDIFKTADRTEVDAGDVITYTVRIEHDVTSRVDAQDVVLEDILPPDLTLQPGSVRLGDICTQSPTTGPTESGNSFSAAWDAFEFGSICEIQFDATVDITAITGETITNRANLAWTSRDDDPEERDYDNFGVWDVIISPPGLEKALTATDQPTTRFFLGQASGELTIGETATFTVTASFPDGETREVVIEDQLPTTDVAVEITDSRITFIGSDLSIATAPSVGDPGGACNPASPTCTRWVLGDVVNQPDTRPDGDVEDTVTFEIDAIVLDDPQNDGAPNTDKGLLNTVTLQSPDASLFATAPFDIVEPRLRVTKLTEEGGTLGQTSANAVERFTLQIIHRSISTADAQTIRITDTLDPEMLWDNSLDPPASDCPGFFIDGVPPDLTTGDVFFSFDSLGLRRGSCEIEFSVRMTGGLPIPGRYTNSATLDWESAPGSAESRQYSDDNQVFLTAFNEASGSKIVLATSLPETGTDVGDTNLQDVAIGEVIEYELVAVFDEGTTRAVTLSDAFDDVNDGGALGGPGVLDYVSGVLIRLGNNIRFDGTGQVVDPAANPLVVPYGSLTNFGDGIDNDNDTIVYQAQFRVADDPANEDGRLLVNEGSLSFDLDTGDGVDPPDATLSSAVTVEVVEPELELTKTFAEVVDGRVTIELQLANTGTSPAYDVVVTDLFDEEIWEIGELQTVSAPSGFVFTEESLVAPDPNAGFTRVTLALENPTAPPTPGDFLPPGGTTATASFSMLLRNNGQPESPPGTPVTVINNTAEVQAFSIPDPDPAVAGPDPFAREYNDSDDDVLNLPALVLEKTWSEPTGAPDDPVLPGQTVTYTITIDNTGAAPLTDAVLEDTPDNVRGEFQVGSVAVAAGGNSDPGTIVSGNNTGDTTIRVEFAQVDAATAVDVTYDVLVPTPYPDPQAASQRLVNQATLTTAELPDRLSDDPTTTAPDDETIVPIEADPIMTIEKTDNGVTATAGSFVTYDITVGNSGDQDASGVVVTDTVPANSTFAPSLSTPGWVCADVIAGSICEFELFDVPANTTQILQFVVEVDSPLASGVTQIENTASVTEDGAENPDNPNPPLVPGPPSTADATDTTPLFALPILDVEKDDGGISVAPGDLYIYRIAYQNIGNQVATNVLLTEEVPEFVVFDAASSTPGWSCADGSPPTTLCIFNLGTVDPGAPATVDFGLRVVFPAPAGAELINNTVEINDDGASSAGIVLRDDALDDTPLIAVPDLVIGKTTDAGPARINEIVEYMLRYDNVGNQNATGVVVREIVPQGTEFLVTESEPTTWSCADRAPGGSVCQTVIGNLGAGFGGTLSFAVEIVRQTADQQIVNIAETNDDATNGLDPTPPNNFTRFVIGFPVPEIPALPQILLLLLSVFVGLVGARALRRR